MALRVLFSALGIFTFAVGALVYEDEEQTLQNALERWWVSLDDTQKKLVDAEGRLVRHAIGATGKILDLIFGSEIVSVRTALASIAASGFGGLIWLNVSRPLWQAKASFGLKEVAGALLWISIILLASRLGARGCVLLLPFVFVPIVAINIAFFKTGKYWSLVAALAGVALSILSDMVLLAGMRRLLAALNKSKSTTTITLLCIGLCLLVFVLFAWLPVKAILLIGRHQNSTLIGIPLITLLCNLSDLTFLLLVCSVTVMLVLHHVAWTILKRPLYAFQRLSLFQYRKSICCAGISIFLFATGWRQSKVIEALDAMKELVGL